MCLEGGGLQLRTQHVRAVRDERPDVPVASLRVPLRTRDDLPCTHPPAHVSMDDQETPDSSAVSWTAPQCQLMHAKLG